MQTTFTEYFVADANTGDAPLSDEVQSQLQRVQNERSHMKQPDTNVIIQLSVRHPVLLLPAVVGDNVTRMVSWDLKNIQVTHETQRRSDHVRDVLTEENSDAHVHGRSHRSTWIAFRRTGATRWSFRRTGTSQARRARHEGQSTSRACS